MIDPDALFAAVAHEVKTPLAIVRGYAELLARGVNGQAGTDAPAAILEAAERLGPAVDDLLLALEIESGSVEPAWESLRLADIVPEAPELLPTVRADAALLGRALSVVCSGANDVSVTVAGHTVTIAGGSVPRSRLELYVAGRIAELHGGELHETPGGVALTLPLS